MPAGQKENGGQGSSACLACVRTPAIPREAVIWEGFVQGRKDSAFHWTFSSSGMGAGCKDRAGV